MMIGKYMLSSLRLGRRSVFFGTVGMNFIFRIVSLYVAQNFILFLLANFLAGTAFPMIYIASYAIVAELSGKGKYYMFTIA